MKKEWTKILHILEMVLPWIIFPSVSFCLMESFHHNPFVDLNRYVVILNVIIFIVIALLLWALTGSRKWALSIESVIALVIGVADYYVIEFRTTPIVPWDVFSIKTAMGVSADYSYALDWKAIISILAFSLVITMEHMCKEHVIDKKYWGIRLLGGIMAFMVLFGEYQFLKKPEFITDMCIYDKLFTPYAMIKHDGIALAFMMELQYMEVQKPANYNSKEVAEVYESIPADETEALEDEERKPNIIVIMDEAFSDPAVLGDFQTNIDYMPTIHGLQKGQENTITGTMNVSVIGGNTANTEFEFLTGATMAFLPDGSVPYQQYIDSPTDSIASYLKDQDYRTVAMHPYIEIGWERNVVYPYLGFHEFYSLKDFSTGTKVREYVDDDSCVDRIIREFERSDEPCFIFNVTMQNHSPYTAEYENFTPDITVEGSESFQLSTYLSLVKLSDAALGRLLEYFSNVEEDTIVVFFGDHQPADSVVEDIWAINGVDAKNLTEKQECARYQVPFVVWANYDIEEQTDVVTSANFLGAQMFDWCGLSKNGYQNYLLGVSEKYAAVTARAVLDKNNNFVDYKYAEKDLLEYNQLQYYRLFN